MASLVRFVSTYSRRLRLPCRTLSPIALIQKNFTKFYSSKETVRQKEETESFTEVLKGAVESAPQVERLVPKGWSIVDEDFASKLIIIKKKELGEYFQIQFSYERPHIEKLYVKFSKDDNVKMGFEMKVSQDFYGSGDLDEYDDEEGDYNEDLDEEYYDADKDDGEEYDNQGADDESDNKNEADDLYEEEDEDVGSFGEELIIENLKVQVHDKSCDIKFGSHTDESYIQPAIMMYLSQKGFNPTFLHQLDDLAFYYRTKDDTEMVKHLLKYAQA